MPSWFGDLLGEKSISVKALQNSATRTVVLYDEVVQCRIETLSWRADFSRWVD